MALPLPDPRAGNALALCSRTSILMHQRYRRTIDVQKSVKTLIRRLTDLRCLNFGKNSWIRLRSYKNGDKCTI